jgi:uroporphyrinogen-III synthase
VRGVAGLSFKGRTVILLEARRAAELANLVRRYGGQPWSVPAMQELPLDDTSESVARLRELCEQGTDVFICLTGVGTRRLYELADQLRLTDRLREVWDRAIVVVRGPKPTAVLRELGVRIDRTAAEPHTSREVLAALANDTFGRAAIQLYGGPDLELRQGLEARGAKVLELPLYRWGPPADTKPIVELIDGLDRADALAVTSATQIHNLFSLASREGKEDRLREGLGKLAIAAVGPVAAAGVREHGVDVAVVPEHPHMGAMVRDLARHLGARA